MRLVAALSLLVGTLALTGPGAPAAVSCPNPSTTRVSVDSDGNQSPGGISGLLYSQDPAVSADGRYIAFYSYARQLVPDDNNNAADIFVHDRWTAVTERVSVSSTGQEANFHSFDPAVSADGRYVAWHSAASNLVDDDTNGNADIFVHDRDTGTTERVSVASDGSEQEPGPLNGSQSASISADGRFVAFKSRATNHTGSTNGLMDVYVRDRQSQTTERISLAADGSETNGDSHFPSISSDGRYVAFESQASNVVAGDTNGTWDVFVHDRLTGTTERVSLSSGGAQGNDESRWPRLNADADTITFTSRAWNLVPGDTNGALDVFVRDLFTGVTERVSVASDGTQADKGSSISEMSADGRFVAFNSSASNLVPGVDPNPIDVFLHDRVTGTTELVSRTFQGVKGNSGSRDPAISADGLFVAFESSATNMVPNDTNQAADIFVRDRFGLCSGPLVYTGPRAAVRGSTVTLTAALSGPIEGGIVTFTLGETTVEAASDTEGLVGVEMVVEESYGLHALRVSYEPDGLPTFEVSSFFNVRWEHTLVDGEMLLRVNTLTSELQFEAPGDVSEIKTAALMSSVPLAMDDTAVTFTFADEDLTVAGQALPERNTFLVVVQTPTDTYVMRGTP